MIYKNIHLFANWGYLQTHIYTFRAILQVYLFHTISNVHIVYTQNFWKKFKTRKNSIFELKNETLTNQELLYSCLLANKDSTDKVSVSETFYFVLLILTNNFSDTCQTQPQTTIRIQSSDFSPSFTSKFTFFSRSFWALNYSRKSTTK